MDLLVMRVNRFLAVAAAAFLAVLPARADQILQLPRVDNLSRVVLPGGPTLGLWSGGKFTATPDALKLGGATVTGVGMTPGTLAAGDDGRIVNAVQAADAIKTALESNAAFSLGVGTISPQNNWRGRFWALRTAPGMRTDYGYIADHVTVDVTGSGQTGPNTADYGRSVTMIKRNTPGDLGQPGEMDGILSFMRQSGPVPTSDATASDMNGYTANLQSRGDPGYAAGMEIVNARINPNSPYEQTHAVSLQLGVIDAFGKNGEAGLPRYQSVNRLTFGYFAGANTGALDRAFFATHSGAGTWQDFAWFGKDGIPYFRVKGQSGDIKFGADNVGPSIRGSSGHLQFLDSSGNVQQEFYQQGAMSINGELYGGGVRVNGVPTLTTRNTIVFTPISQPSNPTDGETYFDATTKKVRTWANGTWNDHW